MSILYIVWYIIWFLLVVRFVEIRYSSYNPTGQLTIYLYAFLHYQNQSHYFLTECILIRMQHKLVSFRLKLNV